MPNYTTIYLKNFKGGLHLARGLTNTYDQSLQVLHSDTIKSAIFVNALQLFPELSNEKAGKHFLESFKISSAFPFYESSDKAHLVHFFPKPEMPKLPFQYENINGIEKKLKNIRYIEQELFQQILSGNTTDFTINNDNFRGTYLMTAHTKAVFDADNCESIAQSAPYQHVTVSRDFSDNEPYYVDKIYFHENGGLFFLLKADEATEKKIISAMRLLQDSGIGTNRNTGNGQFEFTYEPFTLETPPQGNFELNLSLYCPKEAEIKGSIDSSFYGLCKRGGYISTPQNIDHLTIRKRSIYMFTEGSLFPVNGHHRSGKIVDLKPDFATLHHPIWRDGQSIFVPIQY